MGEPFGAGNDPLLALTSILIAVLAASVLFPCVERFRSSRTLGAHFAWAVTGALAIALGVWGMHFGSTLALRLPIAVAYDPPLTALSILPAIAGALLAISISKAPIPPAYRLGTAAVAMAFGFNIMHYTSMEALKGPLQLSYDGLRALLALTASVVAIWAGLYGNIWCVRHCRNRWIGRALGSLVLGLTVSGTHYFTAEATFFQVDSNLAVADTAGAARAISIGIAFVVPVLAGLLLVASFIDQRMAHISQSLNHSQSRFKTLAETSACAIFTFEDTFTYANPALLEITGYSEHELYEMSVEQLFGPSLEDKLQRAQEDFGRDLEIGQEVEIERPDGARRWLYITIGALGQDDRFCCVGSAFDITERKAMERRLRHLAFYDSLTDLPNRVFFLERLQKRLQDRKRDPEDDQCALLAVNLSRLKWINDSFGQAVGDDLLQSLSEDLRRLLTPGDLLARVGGHEFAVLLASTASLDAARDMAEAMVRLFSQPYRVSEQEIQLRCQVGVALASPHLANGEELLQQAQIAMNHARGQNGNSFSLFDKAMRERTQQRTQLELDLIRALAENQFELYYQPIVDLPDGRVVRGFEALIRWPRGDGTFISPAEFIPIAEETGLIAQLGDWVLQIACQQLEQWNGRMQLPTYISVNISSLQLFQPNFVSRIAQLMQQHQIGAGQLKLELTESVLVEDGPGVLRTMHELLALGCEIMIDDFGTGYSSLSYLSRFPAAILKIDQSFIQGIGPEDVGAPIIKAIVSMARELGLGVVAEGIETEHAASLLKTIGCEQAQGYLFARPQPAAEATAKLVESSRRRAGNLEQVRKS